MSILTPTQGETKDDLGPVILDRDDFTISFHTSLAGITSVHCFDKLANSEILIPERLLPLLKEYAGDIGMRVKEEEDRLRKQSNECITSGQYILARRGNPNWFILPSADRDAEATPMLFWKSDINSSKEPRWELYLNGSRGSLIACAQWDDEAGVRDLVALMKEPESCLIMLALLDPENSSVVTNRQELLDSYNKGMFPKPPRLRQVHKALIKNKLTPRFTSIPVDINYVAICIDSVNIPVVVAISLPESTDFFMKRTKAPTISGLNINQAYADWSAEVSEALTRLGWRVVSRSDESQTIWVSWIPESLDHQIRAAIAKTETVTIKRPWYSLSLGERIAHGWAKLGGLSFFEGMIIMVMASVISSIVIPTWWAWSHRH
jgi:hypothetical protein